MFRSKKEQPKARDTWEVTVRSIPSKTLESRVVELGTKSDAYYQCIEITETADGGLRLWDLMNDRTVKIQPWMAKSVSLALCDLMATIETNQATE